MASRSLLKTFFENGDFPTEAQFASLIDSLAHLEDDAPLIRVDVPASSIAAGTAGTYAYDSEYFYVCVATNTWRRMPLNDWE